MTDTKGSRTVSDRLRTAWWTRPFASLALASALALPAAAPADVLVVLNKSDHQAALVDPSSYEVIAKLPTGKGPHEVATSPDGRFAYVSNYGSYGFHPGEQPKQAPGHTITVADLKQRAVRTTFELSPYSKPHGIWVSRDGKLLWVTCEASQAVLELDAATGKVLRAWKTNQETSHMVVPTRDEKKLYVANIGSGTISVIDRTNGEGTKDPMDAVKTIPAGKGSEGMDVSPDTRELWVANRGANTISVISTASDTVVASLDSGGKTPIRVKFTPDGKQAWVSNMDSNTISVFEPASRKLVATIEVGKLPVGIQITRDGRRAFVANTNANQVTVIEVASRKVLRRFTPGTEPDGMAWSSSQ